MDDIARSADETWALLGEPKRNHYRLNQQAVDMTRPALPVRSLGVAALPQQVIFDLNKTALIIVDMQNEFCTPRGWLSSLGLDVSGALKLVEPIKQLSTELRGAGVPVVWLNWGVRPDRLNLSPGTQHTFNPTGGAAGLGDQLGTSHRILQKDSWGAEVIEALTPPAGDIRVDKHRISGFWDTPLDAILRNLRVETLLFAGINADHCVFATLIDANFHGYDTLLLEDCVATTSPDFCLQATLHNVRFAFGFTLKSTDIVAALAKVT